MEHFLVINAGSSSVKLSVFEIQENSLVRVINAKAVRLFHQDAQITIFNEDKKVLIEKNLSETTVNLPNHKVAIEFFLGWLSQQQNINLVTVGHRVVHGGPKCAAPVVIDEDVEKELHSYQPLAPLHQQHNLAPVNVIKELYPNLLQIACFDTAFHQTMPEVAKRFAIPEKYYKEGVRRYGFHGLSYEYIAQCIPDLNSKKIIIAHLGNGASMCALANGKSIATTMSFTPLDGLLMGTRCGDLDPGVVLHLMSHYSLNADEISSMLYKQSGLLAVSNNTNNMRKLLDSSLPASAKAVDHFCYQANRHIGALTAELGGLDQLIFTAGIGENSPLIREKICALASWLGTELEPHANQENRPTISNQNSSVEISVIATNEALMIAKHAMKIYKNT